MAQRNRPNGRKGKANVIHVLEVANRQVSIKVGEAGSQKEARGRARGGVDFKGLEMSLIGS